jgi:hypothetical protein
MLAVDPEGADLEMETVVDTTDRSNASGPMGDRRSLGVRREERILRASGSVFVVAACSDASGALQLQAPGEGDLFVVRRGGEEEYSRSLRHWRRIWTVSAWALAALTGVLMLMALV